MTALSTRRIAMESIDIVDTGCRPEDGVSGFPAVAGPIAPIASQRGDRKQTESRDGVVPDLAGVSETMLWSLYNRASEASRPDGVLVDPESVRIQSAINYDFARHFGNPEGSLAARAVEIDRAIGLWLKLHPEGVVVSLGEGLCRHTS